MNINLENIINSVNKINQNPYFKYLNDNLQLNDFLISQLDFVRAVDNWSKFLGVMVYKVPGVKERTVYVKNLYDEHGNGNIANAHVNTFADFINCIPGKCDYGRINTDIVDKFINGVDEFIRQRNWIVATALLGIIEYVYIDVSKNIHKYVANFMDYRKIPHYSLHETLDHVHSLELFELLDNYYSTHSADIHMGIKKGYNLIYNLYAELSSEYFEKQQLENKNETYPLNDQSQ